MAEFRTYGKFIERVEEIGFMSLFRAIPGLPSVESETPKEIWFQDDEVSDPWSWKSRAAEEKRLAYGCLLGGIKGFVAPRLYGSFHRAFHLDSPAQRWQDGVLSPLAWKAWLQFEDRQGLATRDLVRLCGVKSGKLDAILVALQRSFDLTVAGRSYRVDRSGRPYGWPSNLYETVDRWVPEDWWRLSAGFDRRAACESILEAADAFAPALDRTDLAKRWNLA
jgi:hypothetical protein